MLSDEEIAAIRARANAVPGSSFATTQKELSAAFFDRAALLDEIERLQKHHEVHVALAEQRIRDLTTENAAWHEIGRAVALYADDLPPYHYALCMHCKVYVLQHLGHKSDCPVAKARAILCETADTQKS